MACTTCHSRPHSPLPRHRRGATNRLTECRADPPSLAAVIVRIDGQASLPDAAPSQEKRDGRSGCNGACSFSQCPGTQNHAASVPAAPAANRGVKHQDGRVSILRVSIIDTFLRGNEVTQGYLPRDPVATHCWCPPIRSLSRGSPQFHIGSIRLVAVAGGGTRRLSYKEVAAANSSAFAPTT